MLELATDLPETTSSVSEGRLCVLNLAHVTILGVPILGNHKNMTEITIQHTLALLSSDNPADGCFQYAYVCHVQRQAESDL